MPLSPEMQQWIAENRSAKKSNQERQLTYKGETRSLNEWARLISLKPTLLRKRLSRGWSVEECLETPIKANQYS